MHDKSIACLENLIPEFQSIKAQADQHGQTSFQYIMQHKIIASKKLAADCAAYFNVKEIKIDNLELNQLPIKFIKINFIKNNFILPIKKNHNEIMIAISDPENFNSDLEKSIQFQTGFTIQFCFAQYDTLCRLHNMLISQIIYKDEKISAEIIAHQILSDSIHKNASDIHCEPYQHHYRVRVRIDGLLHEILSLNNLIGYTITSCIKVLANLDIAIKRTPQDGRFSFKSNLGFIKDCRASTYPTAHGEKLVIRLLDVNMQIKKITELGLSEKNREIILKTIQKPQGLILVTGPTGSGKTITLYTILNLLNQNHRNISTIEDPIEIQINGLNQSAVNAKAKFTFSLALRALLRQDPDIMMIGEIRDKETAEMAIRAAETGHLVFSTLHTNNSAEAILRLNHMGIPTVNLASSLELIIAQRLVRKLCVYCKIEKIFSETVLREAGMSSFITNQFNLYQPIGCTLCDAGFQGRIGIFELLPITTDIKNLILNHENFLFIANENKRDNHFNLWDAALNLVLSGETSLEEIYRVIPKN